MCGGKQNTTGPVRKDRKGEAGILIGRRLKQRLPINFLVLAPRLCRGVQKSLSVQQKKQKRQINNIRETDLYKNSFRKGLYQKTGKTNDSAPIEIERLSISSFPVGVSPLRVSDRTNAFRHSQYPQGFARICRTTSRAGGLLLSLEPSRQRRGFRKSFSDPYERKTPFGKIKVRPANCTEIPKGGHSDDE